MSITMKHDSNTITMENARGFVEKGTMDEVWMWKHCECEGCTYCDEVQRLKAIRMGVSSYGTPRRSRLEDLTTGELAIRNAVVVVEMMGAHPALTQVVIALGEIRDQLADYVDGKIDARPIGDPAAVIANLFQTASAVERGAAEVLNWRMFSDSGVETTLTRVRHK